MQRLIRSFAGINFNFRTQWGRNYKAGSGLLDHWQTFRGRTLLALVPTKNSPVLREIASPAIFFLTVESAYTRVPCFTTD